jgi:hypothetical protein
MWLGDDELGTPPNIEHFISDRPHVFLKYRLVAQTVFARFHLELEFTRVGDRNTFLPPRIRVLEAVQPTVNHRHLRHRQAPPNHHHHHHLTGSPNLCGAYSTGIPHHLPCDSIVTSFICPFSAALSALRVAVVTCISMTE